MMVVHDTTAAQKRDRTIYGDLYQLSAIHQLNSLGGGGGGRPHVLLAFVI